MILSETSGECLKCQHHDYCDEKRMVACALSKMTQMSQPITQPFIQPITNTIMNPVINNVGSFLMTIEHQINADGIQNELTKKLRLGCHFREDW